MPAVATLRGLLFALGGDVHLPAGAFKTQGGERVAKKVLSAQQLYSGWVGFMLDPDFDDKLRRYRASVAQPCGPTWSPDADGGGEGELDSGQGVREPRQRSRSASHAVHTDTATRIDCKSRVRQAATDFSVHGLRAQQAGTALECRHFSGVQAVQAAAKPVWQGAVDYCLGAMSLNDLPHVTGGFFLLGLDALGLLESEDADAGEHGSGSHERASEAAVREYVEEQRRALLAPHLERVVTGAVGAEGGGEGAQSAVRRRVCKALRLVKTPEPNFVASPLRRATAGRAAEAWRGSLGPVGSPSEEGGSGFLSVQLPERMSVQDAIIFGRSQPQRQEGSRFGAANVSKRQKNRARIFVDGWEQKNGPMPRMGSKKHLELTREAAAQLGEVGYRAKRMMT